MVQPATDDRKCPFTCSDKNALVCMICHERSDPEWRGLQLQPSYIYQGTPKSRRPSLSLHRAKAINVLGKHTSFSSSSSGTGSPGLMPDIPHIRPSAASMVCPVSSCAPCQPPVQLLWPPHSCGGCRRATERDGSHTYISTRARAMPATCCRCNDSGRCKNCSCVKAI